MHETRPMSTQIKVWHIMYRVAESVASKAPVPTACNKIISSERGTEKMHQTRFVRCRQQSSFTNLIRIFLSYLVDGELNFFLI